MIGRLPQRIQSWKIVIGEAMRQVPRRADPGVVPRPNSRHAVSQPVIEIPVR
jgi:hypothetical protein